MPDQIEVVNDTPTEKVANWFKGIFNVCGNTSCMGNKNPYQDKKTWKDINSQISYRAPPKLKIERASEERNTEQVKLEAYDDVGSKYLYEKPDPKKTENDKAAQKKSKKGTRTERTNKASKNKNLHDFNYIRPSPKPDFDKSDDFGKFNDQSERSSGFEEDTYRLFVSQQQNGHLLTPLSPVVEKDKKQKKSKKKTKVKNDYSFTVTDGYTTNEVKKSDPNTKFMSPN